jgi:hypothetical protein
MAESLEQTFKEAKHIMNVLFQIGVINMKEWKHMLIKINKKELEWQRRK